MKFNFSQDRWVKTILTDMFEVEADSYEDAVRIVKECRSEDLRDCKDDRIKFVDTECRDEDCDISLISFHESCGKPTIVVYGEIDGSYDKIKDNSDEFRNGAY